MPPEPGVSRLRVLSLALDEALVRDDLDEAFALLESREQCIVAMQRTGATIPADDLRELVALNDRLAARLRAGQAHIIDSMRTQAKATQMAKAYSG